MLTDVSTIPGSVAELAQAFVGIPLSVVFADGEEMEALSPENVSPDAPGTLTLEAPVAWSDSDAYLVLPSDIGMEIVDILADSDRELLGEAMRDGLLVLGELSLEDDAPQLRVAAAISPRLALAEEPDFAATVAVGGGGDPLPAINGLAHLQVTVLNSLVDDEALEKMLRRREFAGASWRVPADLRERLGSVSPTYAWSKRQADGSVGVEFALFVEDEELIAMLRPVRLTPP